MKLNQAIALIKSIKSTADELKTGIYHIMQKAELFQGLSRTYQPRDEDGFLYAPESKNVQFKVEQLLQEFRDACAELFDMAATQDYANTIAKADIVVDGVVILAQVPVTYLLFLETQINDIRSAFVRKLPVLPSNEEWEWSTQLECFASAPRLTTKKKSIVVPVVLYEATDKHPAQVEKVTQEEPEGTWHLVNYSGTASQAMANELLRRVDKLHQAILSARQVANGVEATKQQVATPIFDYLLAGLPR